MNPTHSMTTGSSNNRCLDRSCNTLWVTVTLAASPAQPAKSVERRCIARPWSLKALQPQQSSSNLTQRQESFSFYCHSSLLSSGVYAKMKTMLRCRSMLSMRIKQEG